MPRRRLSASEARRIAIGAQRLDVPDDPAAIDIRHIRRAIRTMGLVQLDFVNVLVPAHYLVLYSRLGAYDPDCFRRAVYGRGEFTEQWAHEASIVPTEAWPLLEHRRRAYRPYPNSPITRMRNKNKYLSEVIDLITDRGCVTAQDLPPVPGPKRRPGDWHRSVPRWALEVHFGAGRLAVKERLPNFQRVYDLPERLIAEEHRRCDVGEDEARRRLLENAACALGVATLNDLADYYRMSPRDARPRILELLDAGTLTEVAVEGWQEPGYLAAGARIPREVSRSTLLSPFDPLVWYRPRAERLFDFHYRIEIYVPEAKRRWGYYVLPFLKGEQLAARVDLKAERKASTLEVRAAHLEQGAHEAETAAALSEELYRVADWLGLEQITVGRRGDLAARLRREVKARQSASDRG